MLLAERYWLKSLDLFETALSLAAATFFCLFLFQDYSWGLIADLVNKYSTSVQATVEVAWGTDSIKLLKREPERKRNAVCLLNPMAVWAAETHFGIKDVKMMPICNHEVVAFFWVADPKVKSVMDFAGRRVAVGKPQTSMAEAPEFIFDAVGIRDKVKIQYLDWGNAKQAFLDKTIDVAWTTAGVGRGKAEPGPAALEIVLSERPIRIIGIEQKWAEAIRQKTSFPLYTVVLPAGTMGRQQPEPILAINNPNYFMGAPELDNEIAYEVGRVWYTHVDKMGKYHKAGELLEADPLVQGVYRLDQFHPGAAKFYKEKGLR